MLVNPQFIHKVIHIIHNFLLLHLLTGYTRVIHNFIHKARVFSTKMGDL